MREDEWEFVLELIRVNMQPYYERYSIRWDPEWVETHYRSNANWVVTKNELAVGFVSCEALADRLHIHTFQLAKAVQGRRVGLNVLRHIEERMCNPAIKALSCAVFRDHVARHLYVRMGFAEVGSKGNLVFMELPLVDGRYVLKRPHPTIQRTASPSPN